MTAEGDQLYNENDDSDDDISTLVCNPKFNYNPDTSLLEGSEIRQSVLLASGQHYLKPGEKVPSVVKMIGMRQTGMNSRQHFTAGDCCAMATRYLPNNMNVLAKYQHKAFCGTYSQDGNLFITACQDCNIRLYDTTCQSFKLLKTVRARDVGWSILDTAVSPNGRHLIYSSWSESIHLCNINSDPELHEALPLCPDDRRFCIFSVCFSQNGKEILGGANDGCLYVYDIECRQRSLRIEAHEDDVNAVAFADDSSQILFSGGDDGLCKVWDRRTLNESDPKPVGVLAGHRDGITFIDSRGDNRYLITNSKDQTIKLWDMRLFSPSEGQENTKRAVGSHKWDYRWQNVPKKMYIPKKLPGDTSLMTYAGHCVLQTLIRSRFSPAFSTGQKYIYTGCAAGKLIVYDVLTGKVEADLSGHRGCVRDVCWHPYRQEIMSTSWDRTIASWTYSGKRNSLDFDDDSDEDMETIPSIDMVGAGVRRSKRIAEQKRRQRQRSS